ncbi:MAG TPA: DNA-binding response regulator, partial [Actinomycetota bacterium]|nr:DNA-binding response regulator [Actinomycetota bacterium]
MQGAAALELGRDAFARRAWEDAFVHLSTADRDLSLEPDDIERLATAAYLTARDVESDEAWTRAHHAHQERGDAVRAARAAFWLGFQLMPKGDFARAGGWFARAKRLLDEGGHDCPEQGLVMVPMGAQSLFGGDAAGALAIFEQAADIGKRFNHRDLLTLSAFGRGQALIALGRVSEGIAVLDEAMVAVTAGEVSIVIAGVVYCGVIATCCDLFDMGRAREWTAALTAWCETQPDLVPFRGQCLVHRAQVMQFRGAWAEALEEAERARARLSAPLLPAVGLAFYQLGELHRLRGASGKAEEAYRQAGETGHSPQPGLALLRLAQGKTDAARAGVGRALEEAREPAARSRILPAVVEIELAVGDINRAG